MRRILFTALTVGAMLAAIPATSVAHGGDHHPGDRHREREHRHEHHHARDHDRGVRHERPGGRHGFHHRVGTVSAFANQRLTIRRNDGSTVTGAITRRSEIECEMPDAMRAADQGPGGPGSGPNGGPGGGEDHGHDGPGHDAGRCTAIAPGMVIREATLTLTGVGAVWTHVDLIGS